MTPEEYFKEWSDNCRFFINYRPLHSHEDMMRFAKDYYKAKLKLLSIEVIEPEIVSPNNEGN